MLPSRARTEIGYEANIQQFDQNPTYKRVCRAHPRTRPHTRGENTGGVRTGTRGAGSSPRIRGMRSGRGGVVVMGSSPPRIRGMLSAQQFDAMADELTPARTGNSPARRGE